MLDMGKEKLLNLKMTTAMAMELASIMRTGRSMDITITNMK